MLQEFEMPERREDDPGVNIERVGESIIVSVGQQSLCMSPFNAVRITTMLSLMLNIPIPKTALKKIKL